MKHERESIMTYAIIGSGSIGRALATRFASKGITVSIANRRGPESLGGLARVLGENVKPVSVEDALRADVVFLAVPFDAVRDAIGGAPAWNGRIIVDATNAIDLPAFTPRKLGRPSTEVTAEAAPGARVVKAFNTLHAAVLAKDPAEGGGRRVVFVSGNDSSANGEIATLVERLGFAAVKLGTLEEGGRLQEFGAPLVGLNLIRHDDRGGKS